MQRKSGPVALAIATCVATTVTAATDPVSVIIVQIDGKFPHNGRPRSDGWFALLEASNPRLVASRLRLVHARDLAIDDLNESDIWASNHPSAIYLLRHPSLIAGAVAPAKLPFDPVISDYSGSRGLIIQFGAREYRFAGKAIDSGNTDLREVTISSNGVSTILYDWGESSTTSDSYEIVRWAGDLDRDGRLDLIVDFTTYGSTNTCLFLSRSAKPPALVKRAGCTFSLG